MSPRSGRVVICDDVSWSEPAPRRRRDIADLDAALPNGPGLTVEIDFEQLVDGNPRVRRSRAIAEREERWDVVNGEDVWAELDTARGGWSSPTALAHDDALELPDAASPAEPSHLIDPDSGERRTVVITGHVADRHLPAGRPAARHRAVDRPHGLYADRTAMWAVLLGVMLLLAALIGH